MAGLGGPLLLETSPYLRNLHGSPIFVSGTGRGEERRLRVIIPVLSPPLPLFPHHPHSHGIPESPQDAGQQEPPP